MEIWKQYRDTNYEVSNIGSVRNMTTKIIKKQHQKYNGKYENDYMRVSLCLNGKDKIVSVHRLVAECFLDNFDERLEVNHKNSKRYDNRVENLEMTTKEQNYQHSLKYGNGSQRKPVYCLDNEGNKLEFNSLWGAGKYINEHRKRFREYNINHVCNNIRQNLNGAKKSAYGYEWHWA